MKSPARVRRLMVAGAAVLLGLVALLVIQGNLNAGQASEQYRRQRQALEVELKAAAAQGYTAQDLQPITSELKEIDAAADPLWILPGRATHYEQRAERVGQLRKELDKRRQQLVQQVQADLGKQLDEIKATVAQSQQLAAADSDIEALQTRSNGVAAAQGAAHTIKEYRAVQQQAKAVHNDAAALLQQVEAENSEIQRAAEELKVQAGGSLDALRKAGGDAVSQGRNDATLAAFMNKPSRFKGFDATMRAYNRLEKFAGRMASDDVNQAAMGAAGAQRFAQQVREGLSGGLPKKTIVVSLVRQELWAYEAGGKLVQNTPITSGQPQLPTDVGPMKVLWKASPWKMHSPWPKGSPNWYPDTEVHWVIWFTNTGEGLHDAPWQTIPYGPGSNLRDGSHGCVRVPASAQSFLYGWADVGTPVIVYPGDGRSVVEQLKQITTDDQGNPLTGPKGI